MSPNIVEGTPKMNSTQTKNQQPPKRKLQESELDKDCMISKKTSVIKSTWYVLIFSTRLRVNMNLVSFNQFIKLCLIENV